MKKILLLLCFLFTILVVAKLSPIFAADFCTPGGGWCYGSWASSMVYWTGCKFYSSTPSMGGNYCAGDGYTGDDCLCSDPSTCTCFTHSTDRGPYGKSCALTEGEVAVCRCQEGGDSCEDNLDCRSQWGGAYPYDICGCNTSGQGCALVTGGYQRWCCKPCPGPGCPVDNTGGPTNTPPPPTNTGGPTNTPTPTSAPLRFLDITVNILRAPRANLNTANNSCSTTASSTTYNEQTWVTLYYPPNTSVESKPASNGIAFFKILGVTENEEFKIVVSPTDTSYSCICPNGCNYALTIPPIGTNSISRNVYLYNYADAWLQIFGGNVFAGSIFKSIVPNITCTTPTCLAGAFVPLPSKDSLTSGFPFLTAITLNSSTINTHKDADQYLANIHLNSQRGSAQSPDGFVLGFVPQSLSYQYFEQLAANAASINDVDEINLNNWRNDGLMDNPTNFFRVTGDQTINQDNKLSVADGESVVIFVEGNLIIENNTGGGDKVTSVSRKTSSNSGGFLAFFVEADIVIDESVGEPLDLNNYLNITAVNFNNAHLEGIFFSNQNIEIEGGNTYPNRKFIGAGTFIGRTDVILGRKADDGNPATEAHKAHNTIQALENFLYRADLLINWPEELKSSIINWQEVAPRSFN